MLIKLWPGYWISHLKRMNQKVYEEYGKALNKGNVRYRKFCRFSSNEFWKNIGCLVSDPTFGLGGSRLWEEEEYLKIIGKKRKRRSIPIKMDFMRSIYPILFIVFYFIFRLY